MLLAVKDGKNGKHIWRRDQTRRASHQATPCWAFTGRTWGEEGATIRTTQPLPRAPSQVAPSVVVVVAARRRRLLVKIAARHRRRIIVETAIVLAADQNHAQIVRRRRRCRRRLKMKRLWSVEGRIP